MDQHYLNDEDFDQFLKENADLHKMIPSDRVWANIKRHQHGDNRRVIYICLFLLVAGSLLWLTVNPPASYHRQSYSETIPTSITAPKPAISVSVDDIIAKLRAKSLIPPMEIDAPEKLKPLGIHQRYFPTLEDAMPVLLPPVSEPSPAREIGVNKPAPEFAFEYLETNIPASENQQLTDVGITEIETLKQSLNTAHTHQMAPTPVINLKKNKTSRFSVMMSFAPSIGYRNLFDGNRKLSLPGSSPVMVEKLDVNEFVDHKPSIGFELGGHLKYDLSRSLTLRGGLQLNLTRYSIQAFAHAPEKASVPINNAWGYQSDSVVVYSNIRNIAGNRPVALKNQYLQISMPIGAELKLFGYSKFQVSLAGTLQPSYLLNADQYLLTRNFTNYAKEPSLIRRWNVATGLEAFFSYQRGDVRWQIGPQFRYNLLSTYQSQYPLRENLMEYGLKIGISRPLH
ncbi:MAG: hypothetical protein LCH51_03710 [Bacteroidetes bacterium]|nr:hypothetical protein [Bacteroidota bacterium]